MKSVIFLISRFWLPIMISGCSSAQTAVLSGRVTDCFAGKPYQPAQVSVHVFRGNSDVPVFVKQVVALEQDGQTFANSDQLARFYSLTHALVKRLSAGDALGHAKTDSKGRFSITIPQAGAIVAIAHIPEEEGIPPSWTYASLSLAGRSKVALDLRFFSGKHCSAVGQP